MSGKTKNIGWGGILDLNFQKIDFEFFTDSYSK